MSYLSHKTESELVPTADSLQKGKFKLDPFRFLQNKTWCLSPSLVNWSVNFYFEIAESHPESSQGAFLYYCSQTQEQMWPCFIDLNFEKWAPCSSEQLHNWSSFEWTHNTFVCSVFSVSGTHAFLSRIIWVENLFFFSLYLCSPF